MSDKPEHPLVRAKPFQAVRDLEQAICDYTGAPYCVAVNSCTMALLLAVAWHIQQTPAREDLANFGSCSKGPYIEIPKFTYVSVPMSIIHAGGWPVFRDEDWIGQYQLKPLPVWDCARKFTSQMASWVHGNVAPIMMCVSFHASKILGDTQGGAILHDNDDADAWLREARFDGRIENVTPKDQAARYGARHGFSMIGWHCYMSPDVASRLLMKLSVLPKHNDPLPNDDYPDLSQMEIFK